MVAHTAIDPLLSSKCFDIAIWNNLETRHNMKNILPIDNKT